jgi:hypothetical protein
MSQSLKSRRQNVAVAAAVAATTSYPDNMSQWVNNTASLLRTGAPESQIRQFVALYKDASSYVDDILSQARQIVADAESEKLRRDNQSQQDRQNDAAILKAFTSFCRAHYDNVTGEDSDSLSQAISKACHNVFKDAKIGQDVAGKVIPSVVGGQRVAHMRRFAGVMNRDELTERVTAIVSQWFDAYDDLAQVPVDSSRRNPEVGKLPGEDKVSYFDDVMSQIMGVNTSQKGKRDSTSHIIEKWAKKS